MLLVLERDVQGRQKEAGRERGKHFQTSLPTSASSQGPCPILPISLLHGPIAGSVVRVALGCQLEDSGSAWPCPSPKEEAAGHGQGHVDQGWIEPPGPSQEGPEIPQRTRQEVLHVCACVCLQMCPHSS